ncbi:TPA: SIMPL domain-containing protein [Candidatus Micrarchaeota archaeon]|nr:SIMPL domain-containing protein [Candidatus Micrarchaeota archaeon]
MCEGHCQDTGSQSGCCQKPGFGFFAKKIVMVIAVIVLSVLLTTYSLSYFGATGGSKQNIYVSAQPEKDQISVTGTAKTSIQPNLATASLTIRAQKNTAKEAQESVAQLTEKVRSALKAKGITDEELQTVSFYTYPVTKSWKHCIDLTLACKDDEKIWDEKIIGYKTSHMLKLETDKTSKIGEYLDAAVSGGATSVGSISFGLKDSTQEEVKSQLLTEAVKKAKSQAEKIATAAGSKLLKPIQISESYYSPYQQSSYEYDGMAKAVMAESAPTEISSSPIDISISVSASFEIE